jgi:hypothetical protein
LPLAYSFLESKDSPPLALHQHGRLQRAPFLHPQPTH